MPDSGSFLGSGPRQSASIRPVGGLPGHLDQLRQDDEEAQQIAEAVFLIDHLLINAGLDQKYRLIGPELERIAIRLKEIVRGLRRSA